MANEVVDLEKIRDNELVNEFFNFLSMRSGIFYLIFRCRSYLFLKLFSDFNFQFIGTFLIMLKCALMTMILVHCCLIHLLIFTHTFEDNLLNFQDQMLLLGQMLIALYEWIQKCLDRNFSPSWHVDLIVLLSCDLQEGMATSQKL